MTRSIAIQEERARERTTAMPKGVYTRRTKTVAKSGKTRITTTTTDKKGKVLSERVKELNPYDVVDEAFEPPQERIQIAEQAQTPVPNAEIWELKRISVDLSAKNSVLRERIQNYKSIIRGLVNCLMVEDL